MQIIQHNTALLVMDMQVGVLGTFPNAAGLIEKVADAIVMARQKHIPVLFVGINFRPGGPEISLSNKLFAATKERMVGGVNMEEAFKTHPDLKALTSDISINKHRVSGFSGSDLEMILRAQNIQHLVLTGFATSGVVLSTLREAADKDYQLSVLSDCCADYDDEIHRVLTTKVFSRQAEVLSKEEWFEANES